MKILLALVSVLAAAAPAQARPWMPFGPGGGSVFSLAVDPGNDAMVYAVAGPPYTGAGTLYKSADGGATWKGLTGPDLEVVALAPDHPSTVYAGGLSLRRSENGGRAWSALTLPIDGPVIHALAVAPGGVVFVGSRSQLLRSPDGGRTWAVVSRDAVDITAILVDPADPRRVYHASQNTLYKSEDGGVHWAPAEDQPVSGAISALALSRSAPDRLYLLAANDARIFRSDDGARSWLNVGEVPNSGRPALQVDPRSPDRVYAANDLGIYASADGGHTWREITAGLPRAYGAPPAVSALAAAPSRPGTLYAGTVDLGVARSADAGAHWRLGVQEGLNAASTTLLKFHPLRPDTVYLAQGRDGTRSFRSTDGGRTWQGFARAISQNGLNDLAFDPDDPDRLYAASNLAIWRSEDGGESWTRISNQVPLRIAALGRQTLLASRCGMNRSADGGRTWQQVIACNDPAGYFRTPLSLWVDPRDSRTVYVHFSVSGGTHYFNFEVFRSSDGGVTWTQPPALRFPTFFAVAPGDFRVLYAVDDFATLRLLRSVDGGDHWKVVNRHLPSNLSFFYGFMAVDAADPYTLYISANPLLVSHDGGATFQADDTPFEFGKRGAGPLWTDRTRPGLVYVSSSIGGLFERRFE